MRMLEETVPIAPITLPKEVAAAGILSIALVVGHEPTKPGAEGRCLVAGKEVTVPEYPYNVIVSSKVRALLAKDHGLLVHDVRRHLCGGYQGMIAHVNKMKVDFALELHFNAAENSRAHGCEMLHWHRSEKSRVFANVLQKHVLSRLGSRDRGLKPIIQGGRGAPFLSRTTMPAVIAEPFFGSNREEMQKAMDRADDLAGAYADALRLIAEMIRKGKRL